MSKEPSKVDQRRALGERRAAELEAKRAAPAAPIAEPRPNWSWQKEVKAVSADALKLAAARKKKSTDPAVAAVEEQIAQKKAAKAAKQANREGKKPAMAWLDPEASMALKIAAAKHDVTQEHIILEGISAMLAGKYKP